MLTWTYLKELVLKTVINFNPGKGDTVMGTSLGDELRRLRKARHLSLNRVALETGITKQYLSMVERGYRKAISFEIMVSLSNFYGVPLDYFRVILEDDH